MGNPAYRWCFTLNNYDSEEHTAILNAPSVRYLVCGEETGESGTRHLQGFAIFERRLRLQQVKILLGSDRLHLEIARAKNARASEYCKKEGRFREIGELPADNGHKRSRDDLATEFVETIREQGLEGMATFGESNPGVYHYHGHTFLRNFQLSITPAMRPDADVVWIVGPPGVGKSTYAWNRFPKAYSKEPKNKWWNGYLGQSEVIIDDFAKDCVDMNHLLRWFDKFPISVETKGGNIGLLAHKFVVTSNFRPDEVYPYHEQLPALMRRIKVIEKNSRDEEVSEVVYINDSE